MHAGPIQNDRPVADALEAERFGDDPTNTFRERLADVRDRIAQVCARAGREPASVRLLAITNTVPAHILRWAHAAGMEQFGENKVQEAEGKHAALIDLPVRWSIVGHLQTNKAKTLARFAREFHASDSLRVAEVLDRSLDALDRTLGRSWSRFRSRSECNQRRGVIAGKARHEDTAVMAQAAHRRGRRTGQIAAAVLTASNVGDASQVGALLDRVDGPVSSFTADGVYDRGGVYGEVAARHLKASVVVPPRSSAVQSDTAGTKLTIRDRHLKNIAERPLAWQKAVGYNWRVLVEAHGSRFKRVIGNGLRSRTDDRRFATEVAIPVTH